LFLAVWIVSSYGVYIRAHSVAAILTRGALVGAGEWLVAGLVGVLFLTKIGIDTSQGVTPGAEGIGAKLDLVVSIVAIGGSFSMAIFCLLIWFVVNKSKPEFQQRLNS